MIRTRLRQTAAALILGAILLLLMSLGVNRWLASSRARRMLTSRFEQAFGRPVEVSYFDLAWFPTPRVEAHEVTIQEDPRFGAEYFLRAEAVGANLRPLSLLEGHLELGTLTFTNPNLNLVRTPDGRWNVESWLPAPPPSMAGATAKVQTIARLHKIEIDGGRINLRRGVDVRPFALENVKGFVEQESPGRWRISLSAQPLRSTVQLQESGTLRLVGTIAGTSARLQPAQLALTWSDAALADASRLLFGNDKGVRGTLQLQVSANTEPNTGSAAGARARWVFTLGAALSNLHRWDLTSRADDPSISVRADGYWQPGDPDLTVRQFLVEGEHSKIVAEGGVDWRTNITPFFTVAPSDVSWSDLLAFYRAFSPGLDTALTAEGIVRLNGNLRGWPAASIDLTAQSDGAALRLGDVSLLELSKFSAKAAPPEGVSSLSFVLRVPGEAKDATSGAREKTSRAAESESLHVVATAGPGEKHSTQTGFSTRSYAVRMDGELDHFERWLAASKALGHQLNTGWEAEGGLDLQVAWLWNAGKPIPRPTGVIDSRNLAVRVPLLNQPIELATMRLELTPNSRRVTVNRASAFGAHWQGSILWKEGDSAPSRCDLAADRLDASDLDRWLGPRARPGWLARLFSPATSQSRLAVVPGTFRASGSLRVDTFVLAPLEMENVRADIELDGRGLEVQQISGRFYGGSVSGSLEAKLTANPVYRFVGRLDGVNAAALAATSVALGGRASGTLAGSVQFSAQGVGRDALLASLEGRGDVAVTRAVLDGLNLGAADGKAAPGGHYDSVHAAFMVGGREVQLQRIVLTAEKESYQGDGTVDFGRRMLLNFRPTTAMQTAGNPTMQLAADAVDRTVTPLPIRVIHVSGLLESPRVTAEEPSRTGIQLPPF
ncbi:MAG TPA: AsmA family protein [Candidatus Acidoferrales bacterium]|nr:AsmA family protein [Candidatus Acidoferrales bacterium]